MIVKPADAIFSKLEILGKLVDFEAHHVALARLYMKTRKASWQPRRFSIRDSQNLIFLPNR